MLKNCALVVLLVALFLPAPATAQDPRAVNGTVLLGYTQTLLPPTTTCLGGEPAGQSAPSYLPCSAGTTLTMGRSEVQVWTPASPSARVEALISGPITFVVNCDLNGSLRGPCWGTFEWLVPGVGTWAGYWTAPIMDLVTYESRISLVGLGTGGDIDGKRIELAGASAPGDWYVACAVRIK